MTDHAMRKSALLIGCGKMGGALLNQWVHDPGTCFTVCDPAAVDLPDGVRFARDPAELAGHQFDAVVVAIKPQLVETVLSQYAANISESGLVLSIAAGCSIERLRSALGAHPVVRIMPNLPSLIGSGVAGMVASNDVNSDQKDFSNRLMLRAGSVVWVETEDGLDRITAVSGSGPGYVFEFARAYVAAAESLGFSNQQARDLVLGTIAGTTELALNATEDLATLRNNVTSKNGTTEAGLKALNADDGLSQRLRETVEAAYSRAIELR